MRHPLMFVLVGMLAVWAAPVHAELVLNDFEDNTVDDWVGSTGYGDSILSVSTDGANGTNYSLEVELDTPAGASYWSRPFSPAEDWSAYTDLVFWIKTPHADY
ncbi:MAG: carbohydrate binding domain-containing protein [Planctomycetota bacterium]|nr:carbohydrate binding domain-containing protein [Planctomycetota bacterium]